MKKQPLYKQIQPTILVMMALKTIRLESRHFYALFTDGNLWPEYECVASDVSEISRCGWSYELAGYEIETDRRASKATVLKALRDLVDQKLIRCETETWSNFWISEEQVALNNTSEIEKEKANEERKAKHTKDWGRALALSHKFNRFGVTTGYDNHHGPGLFIPAKAFDAFEEFMARAPKSGFGS